MSRIKDEVGNTYGLLTVISQAPHQKGRAVKWNCECSCGKTKSILGRSLRSGNSTSCGCRKGISYDLEGKTYGELTVLSKSSNRLDNQVTWDCECSCGVLCNIRGRDLRAGNTKSCGCKKIGSQTHGTIYGIYDDTGALIYIGKTVSFDIEKRLKEHIHRPTGKLKRFLDSITYNPTIKPLLENIVIDYLSKVEKKIIKSMSQEHFLLNSHYNTRPQKSLLHFNL